MSFYTYNQNNSGGRFRYDHERGIGQYVIIEARFAEEANRKAESIGLYFDGDDCECCGDRWYEASQRYDKDDVPSIYGDPIETREWDELDAYWRESDGGKNTAIAYVHYDDGTMKAYGFNATPELN